ncbi:MAG TPA: YtxH domain-containing protein [Longimicrobiales bacterium]|nr:YtxH domain-containing protein [Longimicrobiales bacterium]
MRDQDDMPYIVIERDRGGGVGSFVLGALVGAGLALLFAPKAGAETQEELKEHARKLRSSAEERVREAQRQLEERLEDVREGVQTRFDGVKDAMTAGRTAATDARDDLEKKLQRSKSAYRAGVQAAREVISTEAEDGESEAD